MSDRTDYELARYQLLSTALEASSYSFSSLEQLPDSPRARAIDQLQKASKSFKKQMRKQDDLKYVRFQTSLTRLEYPSAIEPEGPSEELILKRD